MTEQKLRRRITRWIIFFMISILLSGVTAFPLETEMTWLDTHSGIFGEQMQAWIHRVASGIQETNEKNPFIMYGTDWLAFAHLIICMLFIGPLRDPVKNKWIIDWAILCCIAVFPLAFIAGPVRDVPFFHQLIDCSFGAVGLITLLIVRKRIQQLELITGK